MKHKTLFFDLFMLSLCARSTQRGLFRGLLVARSASTAANFDVLSDCQILEKISKKEISVHKLESVLSDPVRALQIRRQFLFKDAANDKFQDLPSNHWDSTSFFSRVTVCVLILYYRIGSQLRIGRRIRSDSSWNGRTHPR